MNFLIVLFVVLLVGFGGAFLLEGKNDFFMALTFVITVFLFVGLILGHYVF